MPKQILTALDYILGELYTPDARHVLVHNLLMQGVVDVPQKHIESLLEHSKDVEPRKALFYQEIAEKVGRYDIAERLKINYSKWGEQEDRERELKKEKYHQVEGQIRDANDCVKSTLKKEGIEKAIELAESIEDPFVRQDVLYVTACEVLQAGFPAKSVELYEEIGDYTHAAVSANKCGLHEKAIDLFEKADCYNEAAEISYQIGQFERSMKDYEMTAQFDKAMDAAEKAGLFGRALIYRAVIQLMYGYNYNVLNAN